MVQYKLKVRFFITFVMRPCSQEASTNAGVLSVYLTTILYHHHELLIDIERENIPCVNWIFTTDDHITLVSIHFVSLLKLHATINLYVSTQPVDNNSTC